MHSGTTSELTAGQRLQGHSATIKQRIIVMSGNPFSPARLGLAVDTEGSWERNATSP